MRSMIVVLVGLAACTTTADPVAACEQYADAWTACLQEAYADDKAGFDVALADTPIVCEPYGELSGAAARDAEEELDCITDQVVVTDCTDPKTVQADVTDAIAPCVASGSL